MLERWQSKNRVKSLKQKIRAAKAEADLAQMQKEKADLQAKLDQNQKEIATLQQRAEEAGKNPNGSVVESPAPTAAVAIWKRNLMIFVVN